VIIYPTIELQNRCCVSLTRGNIDQPQVWHVDAVEKAREFSETGAAWMHVTDFDAVVGKDDSREKVIDIIRGAYLPVQVGGGIKTMEHVEEWADVGAGRMVIGTAAVQNPTFLKTAAHSFPDQIVLAVDVWQGKVMTDGWRSASVFSAVDFIKAFNSEPLAGVLFTDIDADMENGEASLAHITAFADAARAPVIASGLVKSADDVSRLKYVRNIAGAIVGRALFNKSVDLAEVLDLAQPRPEKVAEFI